MVTSEFVTYIYKLAHPIVNTIEEIYIYSLQAIRGEVLIITYWLILLANKERTFLRLFGFAAAKVIQLDVALAGYNVL